MTTAPDEQHVPASASMPAAACAPYIRFGNVSLAFGAQTVFTDLSFDVQAGEFVCLLGPSGCGKSTMLRLVSGLIAPATGRIGIAGKHPEDAYADFSFVFQNPRLANWRSALDNVTLASELRFGMKGRPGYRARAAELLALVGLPNEGHKLPMQMSGGERQRVALARALHVKPKTLLMDEPFSALDVRTRLAMQNELVALWQRQRSTVLFVTHDMDEALILADRIIVLSPKPTCIIDILTLEQPRPRRSDDAALRSARQRLHELMHGQAVCSSTENQGST